MATRQKKSTAAHPSSSGVRKGKKPRGEDVIEEVFLNREFIPEADFTAEHDYRTGWTLNYLAAYLLLPIISPAADIWYPRIVRLFYQNLVREEQFFTTSIDGFELTVSPESIAAALEIPPERPDLNVWQPENEQSIEERCNALQDRGRLNRGFVIKGDLPVHMFYLDSILSWNVIPVGHHSERRGDITKVLLFAKNEENIYPAFHIYLTMAEVAQHCRSGSKRSASQKLPFTFLITQLLHLAGYKFSPREEARTDQGHADWKKSYTMTARNVRQRAQLNQPGVAAGDLNLQFEEPPAEPAEAAAPPPPPPVQEQAILQQILHEVSGLQGTMTSFHEEFVAFREDHSYMREEMTDLSYQLQAMYIHQPQDVRDTYDRLRRTRPRRQDRQD